MSKLTKLLYLACLKRYFLKVLQRLSEFIGLKVGPSVERVKIECSLHSGALLESAQANSGTFQPVCSAVVLKPPLAIQSVLWIYDGGWRTDLGDKSDFLSPKNPIISFKKSNHIILENNEKTGVPFSTIIIVKSCFIPISYDDILMLKTSASEQCQVFSGTLI